MKVLIAATEARVAQYAAGLLADAVPGCTVSALGGDAADVALEGAGWDVVVWDLGLAGTPAAVMARLPGVPVVLWGDVTDGGAVAQWLKHGAVQYVLRHAGWEGYFAEVVQRAATATSQTREPEGSEAWRLTQRSLLASLNHAALVANPAGLVVQLNRSAEELTGYGAGEVTGAGLGLFFEPPTLGDAILSVVASGRSARELRQERGLLDVREEEHTLGVRAFLRRKDGRFVLCDVSFGPVTDPGGEYGGCVVVAEEVVRQPDALSELSGPTGLCAMALAQLPVAVALTDLGGQILHGNPEFWRLVGRGAGGAEGTRLQEWLDGPDLANGGLRQIAVGRAVAEPMVVQVKSAAGSGDRRLSLRPLRDGAGRTVGVVATITSLGSTVTDPAGCLNDSSVQSLVAALQVVSGAPDLGALVTAAMEGLSLLTPHDCGYVVMNDHQSAEIWTAAHGVSEAAQGALRGLLDAQLAGKVVVEDARALLRTPAGVALEPMVAESGIRAVCVLPLTLHSRRLGVAVAGWRAEPPGAEQLAVVLSAFGAQLAGMASHTHLVGAAQRSAAVQARLLEVARTLSAGADVDELLRQVAEAALEIGDSDCCTVELLDEERQQFETGSTACKTTEEEDQGCRLRSGPLAWHAVQTKEASFQAAGGEVVSSTATHTTAVAVPLLLDGEPIGVVSVRLAHPGTVSQTALNSLGLLAAQAAVAVNNARLYEGSRRRSQHMEVIAAQAWQEEARARALFDVATAVAEKTSLQEILATVTRSACAEIGFERARIYLADQENQVLKAQLVCSSDGCVTEAEPESIELRRDAGNRLAEAALSSVPYMIDSVEEDEDGKAVRYERLLVPLVAQHFLVGLIVADNPVTGAPVSPQQTRLLRSLAGLASVAIERARVERLKGTLISSVSHELRAPLASIRAYNELVLGGDVGPINDDQRMYLQRVDKSCTRLERLIADLMNLSKLRAGEVTITKAPTDLAAVIQSVIDTMTPRAREAGVQLETDQVQKLPVTVTDQGRLEQVLTNLVENGIKFNESGGWVRVSLIEADSEALFSVVDNGPGIPKAAQDAIFEEFQHGTDVRSRAKEGAGLGLAIARRVIEVLGGRLWLESEQGQGAAFYVAVPLEPVSDDPAPGRTVQPGMPITLGDAHDRSQNTHH